MNNLPIIGITMGEASGIGPEVLVKMLNDISGKNVCRPLAIGDARVLELACRKFDVPLKFRAISHPKEADWGSEEINLIDLQDVPLEKLEAGKHNAVTGRAMLNYTDKLIEFYKDESIHGGVGGPHSKKAADLAGYNFLGYPYYIADMIGEPDPFMMLVANKTRVVNTTLHVSLRKALDMITKDLVFKAIKAGAEAMALFGVDKPHIAVSGLNPHSGEEGMFGTEEEEHIIPAIEAARELGLNIDGPVPADSLFYQCTTNPRYDAYVAMYHDQGHIPVKVDSFMDASAVAIGIPYIFATVDHGCAPDIAWQGKANHGVLRTTVELISQMAKNKYNL
ncbi:PdxA family protein [Oceanidesulfovibrio marinus]|uniref:4-phospho-D-threonate 3-dehydrogenase n=1 Tax=Oceanidesulfovibrio marinus TaxID=370038 RepID=A0A6P1ZEU9_9BACT|nr:4-hydroxythreonine-4-phosphate dehydrogenase PdxA [Oceanidesulfovibrio marinus]TVM30612.1 4-phospho-D-threonate 3-dehydrogenase [Oceanidesulfovibrio marinus]